MLFDTPIYFAFLILVVLLYWCLDTRKQNLFLLAASYFFYGWWDYRFLLLMGGSTLVDWLIAMKIDDSEDPIKRRRLLIFSFILNFTILGIFKYFNFFASNAVSAFQIFGVQAPSISFIKVLLPPGISFYTFQEVAYIADVYRRKLPASRSLVHYALFISLFPHLIAGPIQNPSHLLPQVQKPRRFDESRFFDGLLLIITGLFRKCVIADNCALLANAAFAGHFGHTAAATLIGVYAFAWQIYGDFSGYSDIARGSAQLLGFHFMVNFRQPYLATSLQDFWRRWHISLSSWLRDYLYISLGGNRNGRFATYRNLLLTMVLGGLWHGANWTFVVWGAIHGGILSAERFVSEHLGMREQPSTTQSNFISRWAKRVLIFHVVCIAWVFFRADTLGSALYMLKGLGNFHWEPSYAIALKFLAIFSVPLFMLDLLIERDSQEYPFQLLSPMPKAAFAMGLLVVTALFSANNANAFIYFQF